MKNIKPQTFTNAYRLYRKLDFVLDRLQYEHKDECPPCSIHQRSGAVDGCMKLYVYERSGDTSNTSFYDGLPGSIFEPDRCDQVCKAWK